MLTGCWAAQRVGIQPPLPHILAHPVDHFHPHSPAPRFQTAEGAAVKVGRQWARRWGTSGCCPAHLRRETRIQQLLSPWDLLLQRSGRSSCQEPALAQVCCKEESGSSRGLCCRPIPCPRPSPPCRNLEDSLSFFSKSVKASSASSLLKQREKVSWRRARTLSLTHIHTHTHTPRLAHEFRSSLFPEFH